MEGPPAGAGLAWRRAGRDFLLTLPGGARADTAAGTVTLSLAGGEGAVLQVEGVRPEARAAQAASGFSPLPAESSLPTEERLAASMNAWADAAYKGWSVSRWFAADSSWKLADGSQGFSEEIGAALLPESVARGTWQTVFPLWADTLALQRKTANPLVFSSAAYVGGERDFVRVRAAAVAAQLAQARDALARPDRSILAASDLVTLLVDHGTPDLVRGLGTFLGQMPGGLDVGSSLAYAQDLLDYQRLVRPDGSLDKLLAETVQRNILPSVRGVDGEVYLDLGAGRVDLRSSIWCGTLLLRAGAEMGSSQARAVGRGLLVSSLALADEAGFLPAGLALSGGRIASRVGRLAPETVYGLLPLDRPLAREKPLPGMGNGAWAWTSAKVVSATAGAPGATLVFAYPRGVPYHLVLAGLRPFSLLKLHGIAWHSDPAYDKYSDGWSYDADSRTLFMKITGRIDQEVVDITY